MSRQDLVLKSNTDHMSPINILIYEYMLLMKTKQWFTQFVLRL